jgi:hypothetical protein
MYETDRDPADKLHPETLRRMREVFGGHGCAMCPAPAARLCGGEFFCHAHYPKAQKATHTPRVYRCLAAVDG